MKKQILFFLIVFSHSFLAVATTYYTTGTGNWTTSSIWGTDTNGTGAMWSTITLSAGDTIYTDDDITINSTEVTISVDVTIILDAELSINKKLNLTASSTIEFTSNGSVVGTGPGNSEKIRIGDGNNVWSGNDGSITGPGTLDENSINGVLPIELIFFSGQNSEQKATLKWATASEENFDYFEIQRAVGTLEFASIGEIKGAGVDNYSILEYEFVDERPLNGINYYRLKSIDLDGTFEYSDIQAVKFTFEGRFDVYPNPNTGKSISILLDDFEPHYEYLIYDNSGLIAQRGFIVGNDTTYDLPDLKLAFII